MAVKQYIRFEPTLAPVRHPPCAVVNIRHGDELGSIVWYAPWRQYVFVPEPGTVWSEDCLAAVRAKVLEMAAAAKPREASRS